VAKDGFAVVAHFASNEVEASVVGDQIKAAGEHAIIVKAEVSKSDDASRVFDVAVNAFVGVDVPANLVARSIAGKLSLLIRLSRSQSCSSRRVDIPSRACVSLVKPRNGPLWMQVNIQRLWTDFDIVRATERAAIDYTAAKCTVLLAHFLTSARTLKLRKGRTLGPGCR
jgi:NAD(P)-dependent dehydrogenase (short-subunit alcohol dehydrogenase family)